MQSKFCQNIIFKLKANMSSSMKGPIDKHAKLQVFQMLGQS